MQIKSQFEIGLKAAMQIQMSEIEIDEALRKRRCVLFYQAEVLLVDGEFIGAKHWYV